MDGWWVASYVVLWLLVLALCVVVVSLARQVGTLHLRLGPRGALELDDEGPALGETTNPHRVEDIAGTVHTIGGPGEAQLLLFVSPGCRMCEEVLPAIPVIARAGGMAAYVCTDVDPAESRSAYAKERIRAPVVPGRSLVAEYDVPGTPYVVVLDAAGVVRAKGTVNNLEQMEGLVDTARRRLDESSAQREAS